MTLRLLKAKADSQQLDSKGRTPRQLAFELDSDDSHREVLFALKWKTRARASAAPQLWDAFFGKLASDKLALDLCLELQQSPATPSSSSSRRTSVSRGRKFM